MLHLHGQNPDLAGLVTNANMYVDWKLLRYLSVFDEQKIMLKIYNLS